MKYIKLVLSLIACILMVLVAAYIGQNLQAPRKAVKQSAVKGAPIAAPVQPTSPSGPSEKEKEAMKGLKLN